MKLFVVVKFLGMVCKEPKIFAATKVLGLPWDKFPFLRPMWVGSWGAQAVPPGQAYLRIRVPRQHVWGNSPYLPRYPRDSWALVRRTSAYLVWNATANVIKDNT